VPKDGVGDCTGFEENDINGCENGEVPKFGGAEGVDKGVIPFAPSTQGMTRMVSRLY